MNCPKCNARAACIDSRASNKVNGVRRRYKCKCGERFTTFEQYYEESIPGRHITVALEMRNQREFAARVQALLADSESR